MKCFSCKNEAIGFCSLCSYGVCENCSALSDNKLYCLRKECKKRYDSSIKAIFFAIIIIMFCIIFFAKSGFSFIYGSIIILVALFFNFKYFLYSRDKI
ncbi:MAG: hypothetical protein FADNKDHG_01348 [Holosporales bacterium]